MKPDLPIIGERERSINGAAWSFFKAEVAKVADNNEAIENALKIAELRKSCGASTEANFTVNVRRPPRYLPKE